MIMRCRADKVGWCRWSIFKYDRVVFPEREGKVMLFVFQVSYLRLRENSEFL